MPQKFDDFVSDLRLTGADRSLESDYKQIVAFYAAEGNTSTTEEFRTIFINILHRDRDESVEDRAKKLMYLALTFEAFIANQIRNEQRIPPQRIDQLETLRDALLEVIAPNILEKLAEHEKEKYLFKDRWQTPEGKDITDDLFNVRLFSEFVNDALARRDQGEEGKLAKLKERLLHPAANSFLTATHKGFDAKYTEFKTSARRVEALHELVESHFSPAANLDPQIIESEPHEESAATKQPNSIEMDESSTSTENEEEDDAKSVEFTLDDWAESGDGLLKLITELEEFIKKSDLQEKAAVEKFIKSKLEVLPFEHQLLFLQHVKDFKITYETLLDRDEEEALLPKEQEFWKSHVLKALRDEMLPDLDNPNNIEELGKILEGDRILGLYFAEAIIAQELAASSEEQSSIIKGALLFISDKKVEQLAYILEQREESKLTRNNLEFLFEECRPFSQEGAIAAVKLYVTNILPANRKPTQSLELSAFSLIFTKAVGAKDFPSQRATNLLAKEVTTETNPAVKEALIGLIEHTKQQILLSAREKKGDDLMELFSSFTAATYEDEPNKDEKIELFLEEISDPEILGSFCTRIVTLMGDKTSEDRFFEKAQSRATKLSFDEFQLFISKFDDGKISAEMLRGYLSKNLPEGKDYGIIFNLATVAAIDLKTISGILTLAQNFTELKKIDKEEIDIVQLIQKIKAVQDQMLQLGVDAEVIFSTLKSATESLLEGSDLSMAEKLEVVMTLAGQNPLYEKSFLTSFDPNELGVDDDEKFAEFLDALSKKKGKDKETVDEDVVITFAKKYVRNLNPSHRIELVENAEEHSGKRFSPSEDSETFYHALQSAMENVVDGYEISDAEIAATLLALNRNDEIDNPEENILPAWLVAMSEVPAIPKDEKKDSILSLLDDAQRHFVEGFCCEKTRIEYLYYSLTKEVQAGGKHGDFSLRDDVKLPDLDKAILLYNKTLAPKQRPFSLSDRITLLEKFLPKDQSESFSIYRELMRDLAQSARGLSDKDEGDKVIKRLEVVCGKAFSTDNPLTPKDITQILHPTMDDDLARGLRENGLKARMAKFQKQDEVPATSFGKAVKSSAAAVPANSRPYRH